MKCLKCSWSAVATAFAAVLLTACGGDDDDSAARPCPGSAGRGSPAQLHRPGGHDDTGSVDPAMGQTDRF